MTRQFQVIAAVLLSAGAGAPPLLAEAAAKVQPARTDLHGDALPKDAIARMGTTRFWHKESVACLAYAPDGSTLATGGRGHVTVWRADTGRVLAAFPLGFRTYVRDVSLSPNGKLMAWTEHPGHTAVVDLKTGHRLCTFTVFGEWPTYSPDSNLLALSRWGEVDVLDLRTGKPVHTLKEARHPLAFSPDGQLLARIGWYSGSDGSTGTRVRLWNLATAKETVLDLGTGDVLSLAFSPNGKTLALELSQPDRAIQVWDVQTAKKIREIPEAGPRRELGPHTFTRSRAFLAVTADGKGLWSLSPGNGATRLWELATGQERTKISGEFVSALSPDAQILARISARKILLVETRTGKARDPGHHSWVNCLAFSPDGKTLASGGTDGEAYRWEGRTGKLIHQLPVRDGPCRAVAFSPDGNRLATAGQGITFCDPATGNVLKEVPVLDGGKHMVFSPTGKSLVWSDDKNLIVVSDARSGKGIHRYPGLGKDLHEAFGGGKFGPRKTLVTRARIEGLALSPDGKLLAVINSDRTVHVRDVASGNLVESIRFRSLPTQIAFTADGKALVVGETDRIAIRNLATKDVSRSFRGWSFALSPDGRTIAVGAGHGSIGLHELASGKEIRKLEGHQDQVTALAFSGDGKKLASGSTDTTVLLWDIQDGSK